MNNFNTKASNIMNQKSRTEGLFNTLSFLISCLLGASLFVMMCVIFEVIDLNNWPF